MASTLPTTTPTSNVLAVPARAKLGNFRDGENQNSDASDSDQSDASGRSLSPTRQGLSKTKKRKERRQFGAFADELGDLLGAAFQSTDEAKSTGLDASVHAAHTHTDGDLEMQVESTSSGPKMSKRQRQNLAKMEARKLAKEQSKMVSTKQHIISAERRGMTIQEYRGQRREGKNGSGKSESQKRRSRKERERLRKKAEQGEAMDVE